MHGLRGLDLMMVDHPLEGLANVAHLHIPTDAGNAFGVFVQRNDISGLPCNQGPQRL
jgi:hypothetical protein